MPQLKDSARPLEKRDQGKGSQAKSELIGAGEMNFVQTFRRRRTEIRTSGTRFFPGVRNQMRMSGVEGTQYYLDFTASALSSGPIQTLMSRITTYNSANRLYGIGNRPVGFYWENGGQESPGTKQSLMDPALMGENSWGPKGFHSTDSTFIDLRGAYGS
ncbi:hypothetical protein BS47DRAFT_1367560 [Hydnum rufescens UP504]|uniref:Uncharacterized protein n=1 Tax=Hydnum rufescens UP504 TaxID=1448309 RepID=A0A9P6DKF4_9AGAM|nr:hypothetical protein BS47DRAFT_1367560 [Hydnum rufescens UP504]